MRRNVKQNIPPIHCLTLFGRCCQSACGAGARTLCVIFAGLILATKRTTTIDVEIRHLVDGATIAVAKHFTRVERAFDTVVTHGICLRRVLHASTARRIATLLKATIRRTLNHVARRKHNAITRIRVRIDGRIAAHVDQLGARRHVFRRHTNIGDLIKTFRIVSRLTASVAVGIFGVSRAFVGARIGIAFFRAFAQKHFQCGRQKRIFRAITICRIVIGVGDKLAADNLRVLTAIRTIVATRVQQ